MRTQNLEIFERISLRCFLSSVPTSAASLSVCMTLPLSKKRGKLTVLKDFDGSIIHVCFVKVDALFLAELDNTHVQSR